MFDFVIVVEVIQRELDSAALLKILLNRNGYSCDIVKYPYVNWKELRKKYYNNVRVVLTQSLYRDSVIYELVYRVFGKVKNIIDLRWEQVFNNRNNEDYSSYQYPHEKAQKAYHICWGEKIKRSMVLAGIEEDKLLLTGPIHIDFCRDKYSGLYPQRQELIEKYKLPKNNKILLFISSLSYTTIDQVELDRINGLFGDNSANQFALLSIKTKTCLIKWFDELAFKRRDLTIIYRPHPVEKSDAVLKKLQIKHSNFMVISTGSILPWIKAADYVYNWYSTSLIEVVANKKMCFILRPINIPHSMDVATFSDLNFITGKQDFFDSIGSSQKDDAIDLLSKLKPYYDIDPQIQSSTRLVNFLANIIENENDQFDWDKELLIKMKKMNKRRVLHEMKYAIIEFVYRVVCIFGIRINRMELHLNKLEKEHEELATSYKQINERIKTISEYLEKKELHYGL